MKKLISRVKVLFWKVFEYKAQRKSIENDLMNRMQEFLGLIQIEVNNTNIEEKIIEVGKEWNNIKMNGKKYHKEELLNKYSILIERDNERANNKKKKALKKIKENECRL